MGIALEISESAFLIADKNSSDEQMCGEEKGGKGRKREDKSEKCLTIPGPLPRAPWNRKVVDLVLEVVRLESNGG